MTELLVIDDVFKSLKTVVGASSDSLVAPDFEPANILVVDLLSPPPLVQGRTTQFGARTPADARDHVAPPSQVSQGAQELRRGDRAREGCDQLLPGTSRPRQTLAAPKSAAFHCSAESRVGPYQMHFGPPALPTRGRRVAIVRAITPPPRGACSIGR